MTKPSTAAAFFQRVDFIVRHVEEKALALSVLGLASILILNVVLRCFNSSIISVEELSQFLMFFITFLGCSYSARSGMHIRMSMLSDALKGRPRKALAVAVAVFSAAVMFLLAWLSLRYVLKVASLHRVSPILQIPVQYIWFVMPAGFFLTGVQYTLTVARNLMTPGAWISYSNLLENEPEAFSEFERQIAAQQSGRPADDGRAAAKEG
ncbi:MAG: TRAP transporter small permease [Deltaproteobacteria bacterium]|jgi:TRAP-type C4-dicarboxylate transport system permease small subunit|nr:TRAP transporter small permease [Deltaproteobacteria bacterium]